MHDYQEILLDKRWKEHRLHIIERDKWTCKNCSNDVYIKTYSKALVTGTDIFDQRLIPGYRAARVSTTYLINLKFNEVEYNVFLQTPTPFRDVVLGEDVYFDLYGGRYHGIRAIKCSDGWAYAYNLHVHHKYYQDGKMPWEYPENSLITLCWECHQNLHAESTVQWLNAEGKVKGLLTACSRCGGAGTFPEYRHVESGICFECRGRRYLELSNL